MPELRDWALAAADTEMLFHMHNTGCINLGDETLKTQIEDIVADAAQQNQYQTVAAFIELYNFEESFYLEENTAHRKLVQAAYEAYNDEGHPALVLEAIEVFAKAGFNLQWLLHHTIAEATKSAEYCPADDVLECIIEHSKVINCNDAFITAIINGHATAAKMLFDHVDLYKGDRTGENTPMFIISRHGCDLELFAKICDQVVEEVTIAPFIDNRLPAHLDMKVARDLAAIYDRLCENGMIDENAQTLVIDAAIADAGVMNTEFAANYLDEVMVSDVAPYAGAGGVEGDMAGAGAINPDEYHTYKIGDWECIGRNFSPSMD